MTQVERKGERILRVKILQHNNEMNMVNILPPQKDSPKIIFKMPLNVIQKKSYYRRVTQKIPTEGGEDVFGEDVPQLNHLDEIPLFNGQLDKEKNIKIFKRKVRKTQKNLHTESDQYSLNFVQEKDRDISVRVKNQNETQFLSSTDESNNASSQKKRETNQKILSLRSLNNKIIPLYRGVEDIISEGEQIISPKKSLSSYSILQQKIETKGIERIQLQKRDTSVLQKNELDQFKKIPMLQKFKKENRVQSESRKFKNFNDLLTLENNRENPQKENNIEQQTSIQDYIFFREGKILQQYENFKKQQQQEDQLIPNKISTPPHQSSQNKFKNNNLELITKVGAACNQSQESFQSHKQYRIQTNVLKERRLSILQDYKSVDFKDLTSSSSSSSSTSSLCLIKNSVQQKTDHLPIKNLYNISPEKQSAKCLHNKISPQSYKRNVQGIKSKIDNDLLKINTDSTNKYCDTPPSSQTTKSHKNDQNIQFFLKSQKKLTRNFNTNKSPSSAFNSKRSPNTNNDDKYDYDIRN